MTVPVSIPPSSRLRVCPTVLMASGSQSHCDRIPAPGVLNQGRKARATIPPAHVPTKAPMRAHKRTLRTTVMYRDLPAGELRTMLAWTGALFSIAAGALTVPILRHAFGRSLGTGLMVLLIPAYVAWFAVGQFEHRRKAFLVPAWFACIGVAAVCLGVHATRISLAELLAPVR